MPPATRATETDLSVAREFAGKLAARLGGRLRDVYFFGSRATGTPAPWSDYDLLVVLRQRDPESEDAVHDVSISLLLERGWDLSPKVYDAVRFDDGVRAGQPFVSGVARDGIRVWTANSGS